VRVQPTAGRSLSRRYLRRTLVRPERVSTAPRASEAKATPPITADALKAQPPTGLRRYRSTPRHARVPPHPGAAKTGGAVRVQPTAGRNLSRRCLRRTLVRPERVSTAPRASKAKAMPPITTDAFKAQSPTGLRR